MKHLATTLLLSCCLTGLCASPAIAGEPVTASPKSVVIPPAPPQDDWFVTLAAYFWASSVSGDSGLFGVTYSADMKFQDLLEDLDFAYQGYFEVGRGRWSFGLDGIYAELSDESTFARGFVSGRATSEMKQATITPRIIYRLHEDDRCDFDVFAGFRWNYFDLDLDVRANLGLGGLHISDTEDWFDPIIGFRTSIDLTDRWFLRVLGDIGGFGAASDLTWQAMAGFAYRFNDQTAGFIGYRALGVDYEDGGFLMDTITHGPMIGVAITF